jgi:hypothetical protein
LQEGIVLPGGSPPLVPIWPGARVIERNPYPFFPFNPRRQQQQTPEERAVFCQLLKLAWISERPCFLPPDVVVLSQQLREAGHSGEVPSTVLAQFEINEGTGLLFFPPQLLALERLVNGEDMYSLLWDQSL